VIGAAEWQPRRIFLIRAGPDEGPVSTDIVEKVLEQN
jgi:hypothetical protein